MRTTALTALALLTLTSAAKAEDLQKAVVAGGCFWCVESDFDAVEGVTETISGYAGGTVENPSYKQVVQGGTGHAEAVEITYDADIISYEDLLHVFWRTVDPTDAGGQFCDRGDSYRTAVFITDPAQRAIAEASRAEAEAALGQQVVTEIAEITTFYPAEDYHQDFYLKSPLRYKTYRQGCRRDDRVEQLWGDEARNHGS
ncbi:peptide-methionine (S)-S-oxide reductase MsrA [Algicella marina]|uniref:Peptide methionine sulfoxide reductase MsrA n=1 Tax=Algicella marina TaxID=2683284 RepID=A0A6P1SW84_9RHOB|nr:peptide-methionine (S)-S-oxide reductase MsrA [Algicella marina]QHQ33751.1 peptide-methionine (S)-S-oxide reductase MsrA [Algicella marina]